MKLEVIRIMLFEITKGSWLSFQMKAKQILQDISDSWDFILGQREGVTGGWRIFFDPSDKGEEVSGDLQFLPGRAVIAVYTVLCGGHPGFFASFPPALQAVRKLGQKSTELEDPALNICPDTIDISSGPKCLEGGSQQSKYPVFLVSQGQELLDNLGKIAEVEGDLQITLQVKEGLDQIGIADRHKVPALFFVIKDADVTHGLQSTAETVAEFTCSFGDAFHDALVLGKKSDQLVLLGKRPGLEDEGFRAFERH